MISRTGTGIGTGDGGDPEIARVAAVFADPRPARVLMAPADGRTLPAGRLAEEAGVAASTISNHLAVLLQTSCSDLWRLTRPPRRRVRPRYPAMRGETV